MVDPQPNPGVRGQEKKIEEMIENINKLKEDVKDMKQALEECLKAMQSNNQLLSAIEKNV